MQATSYKGYRIIKGKTFWAIYLNQKRLFESMTPMSEEDCKLIIDVYGSK